jgi:glycine cleavage system H protein
MAEVPEDLGYTKDHEWVKKDDSRVVRVGITDHAADQLGDIVYVSLPTVGQQVVAGDPIAELESTKSVSDVFSPASGVISAINEDLGATPESINASPYGDGWLFEVELDEAEDLADLLDAAGYREVSGE